MAEFVLLRTAYTAIDRRVDVGAGFVYWALLASSTTKTVAYLRDGSGITGDILAQLRTVADDSRLFLFDPPLPYWMGLFLDVDASVGGLAVGYRPGGIETD